MNRENIVLFFDNAQISLPNGVTIPPACSFSLQKFKPSFFLGGNGVGKTTLLNILAGKHRIDNGQLIEYCSYKKCTARLYQFNGLFFESSAYDNIKLSGADSDSVLSLLSHFNMLDKKDIPCRLLSGGQQRIVQFCRAILSNKWFWIFDEPTSGVDSESCEKMAEIIFSHARMGKVIAIATHDTKLIENVQNHGISVDIINL